MLVSEVSWGDIPTWVSAIGAIGVFIGGIIVLRPQLKELQHAAADRRAQYEERRRSQAVLVYAWLEPLDGRPSGSKQLQVRVRNSSQQPVYECQANVVSATTIETLDYGIISPGLDPTRAVEMSLHLDEDEQPTQLRLELSFIDTFGTRWTRHMTQAGRLVEALGQPEV